MVAIFQALDDAENQVMRPGDLEPLNMSRRSHQRKATSSQIERDVENYLE